jgi:hypothetical protein
VLQARERDIRVRQDVDQVADDLLALIDPHGWMLNANGHSTVTNHAHNTAPRNEGKNAVSVA